MKKKKPEKLNLIFILLFLSFVFFGMSRNISLIKEPLSRFFSGKTGFSGFVDEVQNAYPNNFKGKDDFYVNLNGLYARATGRRYYNQVVRLDNDMLTEELPQMDMTEQAECVSDFAKLMQETGIHCLYVHVPSKIDLQGKMLPEGFKTYQNENADELLSLLSEHNVPALDLRPTMTASAEQLEANFYSTDHHWNPQGAFFAFQTIINELESVLPANPEAEHILEQENWEKHTKPNWFLGYHGKRVGCLYGGVDDLMWYTPRFDTEMSCAINNHWEAYKGSYEEATIRDKYIEEKDLFGYNAYCVYIGGDYPLVRHKNSKAPYDNKVVILKDSFTLPVQTYMATLFSEVDVIDPRYFTDYGVAEYVEALHPDIVLMMFRSTDNEKIYSGYDVPNAREEFGEAPVKTQVVRTEAYMETGEREVRDGYLSLLSGDQIQNEKWYTITFSEVNLSTEDDFLAICVYDKENDTEILRDIFDIDYGNQKKGFEFVFKLAPDVDRTSIEVRLYAGLPDHQENSSMSCKDLKIYASV